MASEMMLVGRPKCGMTCVKTNSVVCKAEVVILEKQQTTTQMALCSHKVIVSPLMKSISIDSQGKNGMGKG